MNLEERKTRRARIAEEGEFTLRRGEDRDAQPRRDYDAVERGLIAQGLDAEAKARWHRRTGK